MTGRFIIYALVDPRDGAWRYIGYSTRGLARPRMHREPSNLRGKSHKIAWIKSLRTLGLTYDIEVLEELPSKEACPEAEREWIAEAKRRGVRLTNWTDGGDGLLNPSTDVRQKISRSRIGKKMSEETRRKLSEIRKGRRPSSYERMQLARNPSLGGRNRWAKLTDVQKSEAVAHMRAARQPPSDREKAAASAWMAKRWADLRVTGRDKVIRDKIKATNSVRIRPPFSDAAKSNMRKAAKALWANPEHRARMVAKMRTKEMRQIRQVNTIALWESPEHRVKVAAGKKRAAAIGTP